MTHRKLFVLVSVAVTSLVAILYFLFATILLNGFTQLEQFDTRQNVERALNALSSQIESLTSKNSDWAAWDETYAFVEDGNPAFIENNLNCSILAQLDVDVIVFIHSSGRIVSAMACDAAQLTPVRISESLISELATNPAIGQAISSGNKQSGLLKFAEGIMVVAIHPMLDSHGNGPSHGTLFFGRYVDTPQVATLSKTTHLNVTIRRLEDPTLPADFRTAAAALSAQAPIWVTTLSKTQIAGFTLLNDINDQPAVILRVDLPRSIYQQAKTSTLYLLFSLILIGLTLGGVAYFFSVRIFNDITERQRITEALGESEARLLQILEQMPYPVEICDPNGTAKMVNQSFLKLFGVPSADLVVDKYNVFQDSLTMDVLGLADDIRRVYAGELVFIPEVTLPLAEILSEYEIQSAANIILESTMFPVFRTTGEIWDVVTIWKDITERKRAEESLRRREQEYKTVVENTPDVIVRFDRQYRHIYVNPIVEKEFGLSPAELLGKTHRELGQPPERADESEKIIRQIFETGQATVFEVTEPTPTGDKYFLSHGVPEFAEDGSVKSALFVHRNITERKHLQEKLRQQATTDELTGILNRRQFLESAHSELKRAIRLKHPLTIVMLDIDHFKHINDAYGHAAGDQMLIAFTQICQQNIREVEIFARIGGDEFAMLLPETNSRQAFEAMDRCRLSLATIPIDLTGKPITITVSAGIASLSNEQESLDSLLVHADQALYQAKKAGRNRVIVDNAQDLI